MATSGSGVVAPNAFPVRKPTDSKQSHGRVHNPVRYYEVGGAARPGIWNVDNSPDSQSSQVNIARVERATSTKGAHGVQESEGA